MKKTPAALVSLGVLSFALAGTTLLGGAKAATDDSMSSQPFVQSIGQNPDNLTPGMGGLAVDNGPVGLMQASLIRLDIHDKWQPYLAKSWNVSKDGLTYTFHLDTNMKWSNGDPITPDDMVYTWKFYSNTKIQFAYVTGWDYIKNVKAVGKDTVVYTLKKPYSPFLETIGLANPVPKNVVSKWTVDQINHGYFNKHAFSSGPYILQSWVPDQQLVLVPNPNWGGPKVHISQFIFRIIPDSTTAFNELVNQNLTIGGVPPEQLGQIGSLSGNFKIISPLNATYGQITPVENGFLKDAKVRQALDYATPKAQIVKYILKGMGVPAKGDQVPGSFYYNPTTPARAYDLSKAAALLKAEGFTKGSNGWLQKDGKELQVPIWTGSTSHTYINVAQAVSASWQKIGVHAPVKTADWSFIFGDKGPQFDGKMEALLFSWGQGVFPDDTIDFNSKYILKDSHSSGENAQKYSNPLMDKLTVQGTEVTDPKARQKIYYQIQDLLYKDVPLIFIYWVKSDIAVSTHLHGFDQSVFGTTPVWDWTLS